MTQSITRSSEAEKNKARGAVVAALAGVLALGAVPAVALATGSDVSLQIANEYNGSLNFVGGDEIQATGLNLDIEIDSVELASGTVAFDADSFDVAYYESNEDGDQLGSVSAVKDPGYYLVVATGKGTYANQTAAGLIHVVPKALPKFTVYEVNPDDARDLDDKDFMYTGSDLNVGVYAKDLVEGQDYTYKILKEKTDNVDQAQSVAVHDAGTYVVYVIGQGKYAGADPEVYQIEVDAFDFIGSQVVIDDVIGSNTKPAHPSRVYRVDSGNVTELDPTLVDLTLKSGPGTVSGASVLFDKNGEYTFAATYDKDDKNLTESTTHDGVLNDYSVYKVAQEASFTYKGEAIAEGATYSVDLSKYESFDGKLVDVLGGENSLLAGCTVTVNGIAADLSTVDFSVPGTYNVSVKVNPTSPWTYGGARNFTVKVVEDVLDADANVFVTLDDKLVTSVEKDYDGKAITFRGDNTGNLKVNVEDADGHKLSYGSANDYTVTIYNEYNENVTGSIKDAGTYTLVVRSSTYELTGTTEMTITINKADLTTLKVGALKTWSGAEYLQMAGTMDEDGNPVWYTAISNFDLQYLKNGEWADVWGLGNITTNGSLFSVEKWNAAKGEWVEDTDHSYCEEAGKWRIVMKGDATFTKNYKFADEDTNSTSVEFLVVDPEQLEFTDVKPGDNFFNCIDWMFDAGYVKGYANTNVYGQYDSITRADVVTILFRMAEGTPSRNVDLGYSETEGWQTGFGDVDGNMYYAKAIGWANKMGVVHGYDDGSFRPEQNVTREELATMLANFAKVAYGEDVKLDEAALETMPDAGSVSTFAEKAVSWCVANGLMGNGGSINPASSITRGETAAMGYNYMTKVVGMPNVNADA